MELEELGKEFQILWQNIDQEDRNRLGEMIRIYYEYGDRANKILDKLMEKVD